MEKYTKNRSIENKTIMTRHARKEHAEDAVAAPKTDGRWSSTNAGLARRGGRKRDTQTSNERHRLGW